MRLRRVALSVGMVGLVGLQVAPAAHAQDPVEVIAEIAPSTRGVEAAPGGKVIIAENAFDETEAPTGAVLEEFRARRGGWQMSTLGSIDGDGIIDLASTSGGRGDLYLLSASELIGGTGDVTKWNPGAPRTLANISDWRATHPDPYDLEDFPLDTNQWAIAPLPGGGALVADAGGNEVLRVGADRSIHTVARFTPVPSGSDAPPVSEAVPTSVAVGPDGAWYVGQLVGFPGLPGTARVYRIEPGTTDALCEPDPAPEAACTVFADGFTSIMDIDFGPDGSLYVLELSTLGWAQLEIVQNPAAVIGALWKVTGGSRTELAPGQLFVPGGLAVGPHGDAYVTTNFLGLPGVTPQLVRVQG